MQTGLIGLLLWSFLMANAAAVAAKELTASNSFPIGLAVVGMHTGEMLAGTGGDRFGRLPMGRNRVLATRMD